MSLKVGDKVSFLNENLNGIVAKVLNSTSVEVITEDGFGIPALIAELVKVGGAKEKSESNETGRANTDNGISFSEKASLEKKEYLCFCKSSADNVELFVLNNSGFKKFIIIRAKILEEWVNLFSAEIGKQSYKFVDVYSLQKLDDLKNFSIEMICTDYSVKELELPQVCKVKLNTVKFYKESSFKSIPVIEKDAMVIPIEAEKIEEIKVKELLEESVERLEREPYQKLKGLKVLGKIDLNNPKKGGSTDELDIHVEKLKLNFAGKSNGQIVQMQISAAKDFIDKSIIAGKAEVVLIHGVGNGRLKAEVRKLLNSYYGIRFEDADFRKYGEGATLVYLK